MKVVGEKKIYPANLLKRYFKIEVITCAVIKVQMDIQNQKMATAVGDKDLKLLCGGELYEDVKANE